VPRAIKFKLAGIKKFPFNLRMFVLGKLAIRAKVELAIAATLRSTTGLLAQIKGIKLFRAFSRLTIVAIILTKAMTKLRVFGSKLFAYKELRFVTGIKSFTYQIRQQLTGRKLFKNFRRAQLAGARIISKSVGIFCRGDIKKIAKLTLSIRGKKDITNLLIALGLLEDKKA
jgi:hypothetical protein